MHDGKNVSVSFLITAEDYRLFRMDTSRLAGSAGERKFAAVTGAILLAAGLAGAFLWTRSVADVILWGALMLGGVVAAAYPNGLGALLEGRRALREYAGIQNRLSARIVELKPEGLHIQTRELNGTYPYEILCRCVRTRSFFLFELSEGEFQMLPMRMLSEEEKKNAEEFLSRVLAERYQKFDS